MPHIRELTKAAVDAAEPLDFSDTRQGARTVADSTPRRQRSVTIVLHYRGAPFTFTYAPDQAAPVNEMEQMVDTLLMRDGWSAPALATNGNGTTPKGKPKAEYLDPTYNNDGDPCCPVHRKVLTEGRYGLYCSAKAKDGEAANDKGYCNIKFKV